MPKTEQTDLAIYCQGVALRAKRAAGKLMSVGGGVKIDWLRQSAAAIREAIDALAVANAKDLDAAPSFGMTDALTDRLRLTPDRIEGIAIGLEEIAALPEPIGQVIDSTIRPNGLDIHRIRVPLGVVFFIYESRPNVTADAAAICVKAGNAVILRGGKEAQHSSRAIVDVLRMTAKATGVPSDAVQLINTTDREAVGHFLRMPKQIDVAIPRGGQALIQRVAEEAQMPVIKHFAGNCHVYVDRAADLAMAETIVVNSKCQRVGVCNAAESLLVHEAVAKEFLPRVAAALSKQNIELRGDERACQRMPLAKRADDVDFGTEYLGPTISVAVVESLDQAISHIHQYGSGHTDAIVTRDLMAAQTFATRIDSSAVIINASTRFNDGGQFGLGAEIGISTDKFHARGPCGINELTSYKYIVHGNGQIRE